jgi:gentisate 1,2-dioxygenase
MCDVADEPDLGACDGNLEHVHLQPLREMSGSLTPTRVLTAVRCRQSGADLQKPAAPADELVPTSLRGDHRVWAMSNLELGVAPFVSGRFGEAGQKLHTGEVVRARRGSHKARPFVPCRDGMYTLVDGGGGSPDAGPAPANSEQRCARDPREQR